MLNVLVRVTIGIGDVIHNSNADARDVSFGFISFMIGVDFLGCKDMEKVNKTTRQQVSPERARQI